MDDTNSLIEQRKAKLAALRAKGIDPFKNKFTPARNLRARPRTLRRGPRSRARRPHHRAPRHGQIHVHGHPRPERAHPDLRAEKCPRRRAVGHFPASRPGGFHRRARHAVHHQDQRDFRQDHRLHHPGQGVAPAAGQVARARRHGNPLPPALSRFDGQPGGEGTVPDAQRNHPRNPEFPAHNAASWRSRRR